MALGLCWQSRSVPVQVSVTQDIDPVPEVTIETLKEDKQWLSEQRS